MAVNLLATTNPGVTSSFTQREALSLAPVLALRVAEQCGTRLLLIKGDSYTHHGLRRDPLHADVDVLIPPEGITAFLAEMNELGWHSRYGDHDDYLGQHHSKTLVHPNWPIDIDVHRWFPGFLRDPADVFERLWAARTQTAIGSHRIPITSFAGSVLVMILHSVRSTGDNPRHAKELRSLASQSATWTETQRTAISELAVSTGCSQSLADVLPMLRIEAGRADGADPAALAAWRATIAGHTTSPKVWLRAVRAKPLSQWPRTIWELIWPAEDYMRTTRHVEPGNAPLRRARRERLINAGRRQLARAVRSLGWRQRNPLDDARKRSANPFIGSDDRLAR